MSGVTGSSTITSREKFNTILDDYKQSIKKLPGLKNIQVSGSYNSDITKNTFGDIDLIITMDGTDKKQVKKNIQKYLVNLKKTSPFVSEKYKGRMSYNSGEIITINYNDTQIDNIIALSETEADFKLNFLNLPAEKQGLLLGLMKVVFIEGWDATTYPLINTEEVCYNLSSKELQLRLVQYYPGTLKEKKRTILNTSTRWNEVQDLIPFDFNDSFEELVQQIKLLKPRSIRRIQGVFKSMVSVKSGEIGKPKGQRKQYCLDIVQNINKEN